MPDGMTKPVPGLEMLVMVADEENRVGISESTEYKDTDDEEEREMLQDDVSQATGRRSTNRVFA
jgi:hypothetical protein